MAPFNPTISPTNDPLYIRYTDDVKEPASIKPTGQQPNDIQPKGLTHIDQSGKYAWEAEAARETAKGVGMANAGKLLESAAGLLDFSGKAIDATIKQKLDEAIYNDVEAARTRYTQELLEYMNPGSAMRMAQAKSSEPIKTEIFTDTDGTQIPVPLQSLESSVSSLEAARTSGKISGTYYTSRLLDIAKKYRSQYPGYRQYVDTTISRITGMNPANELVGNLTSDINTMAAAAGSKKDKVLDKMYQHLELNNMDKYIQSYRAGLISEDVAISKMNRELSIDANLKRSGAIREEQKGRREDLKVRDERALDDHIVKRVQSEFNDIADLNGLGGAKFNDYIADIMSGRRAPPSEQEARQYSLYFRSKIQTLSTRLYNDAVQNGFSKTMDVKEIKDMINGHMDNFNRVADYIDNKEWGLVAYTMNMNKALSNDADRALISDPNLGPPVLTMDALHKRSPEAAAIAASQVISGKFNTDLSSFIAHSNAVMLNQGNVLKNGIPNISFKDVVDKMTKAGYRNPAAFDDVINNVNLLTDPKLDTESKTGVATAAFGPGNTGFLSRDWRDSKGNPMQMQIFTRMTKPDLVDATYDLGKKDGSSWIYLKDWANKTFGDLFLRDLKDIDQTGSFPSNLKLAWDDTRNQFKLILNGKDVTVTDLKRGQYPFATPDKPEYQFAANIQPHIIRLNLGLNSLSNIASKDKEDVGLYLWNVIREANPQFDVEGVQGAPALIMNAIRAAKSKAVEEKRKWQ